MIFHFSLHCHFFFTGKMDKVGKQNPSSLVWKKSFYFVVEIITFFINSVYVFYICQLQFSLFFKLLDLIQPFFS